MMFQVRGDTVSIKGTRKKYFLFAKHIEGPNEHTATLCTVPIGRHEKNVNNVYYNWHEISIHQLDRMKQTTFKVAYRYVKFGARMLLTEKV